MLGVRAEEVHVVIEISVTELKLLKKALDNSTISYDSSNEEQKKYYEKYIEFYEFLSGSIKGAENGEL